MWHGVVDRDVVAAHRNPADVVHGAPPLPPPLPSRRSPARPPAGPVCRALPSLARSGGGGEGARARACQGQLTSVTFSAIHWLFADSGGAMMDCPARADERPRRPRGGRVVEDRYEGARRRRRAAATSERYVPHQEKLENHHSIGGSRRRRKGRAAESAPKHVARTKDGRWTGIRRRRSQSLRPSARVR